MEVLQTGKTSDAKALGKYLRDTAFITTQVLETRYKRQQQIIDNLKNDLDNTPKIFKNKRKKLEQDIKEATKIANEYYNEYLDSCNDLGG